MSSYTIEDASRVFGRDMTEVHAHFERLAAEQRPAVRRAIAQLTGTAPPASTDLDAAPEGDSDDHADDEHDPGEE